MKETIETPTEQPQDAALLIGIAEVLKRYPTFAAFAGLITIFASSSTIGFFGAQAGTTILESRVQQTEIKIVALDKEVETIKKEQDKYNKDMTDIKIHMAVTAEQLKNIDKKLEKLP